MSSLTNVSSSPEISVLSPQPMTPQSKAQRVNLSGFEFGATTLPDASGDEHEFTPLSEDNFTWDPDAEDSGDSGESDPLQVSSKEIVASLDPQGTTPKKSSGARLAGFILSTAALIAGIALAVFGGMTGNVGFVVGGGALGVAGAIGMGLASRAPAKKQEIAKEPDSHTTFVHVRGAPTWDLRVTLGDEEVEGFEGDGEEVGMGDDE